MEVQQSSKSPLKRGLFQEGIWHCNCNPRLPADKFQVKNGGKNHGKWFYTCQKPQPSRCGFFLWSDDAKMREKSAVINNSRSEPQPNIPLPAQKVPQTPRKQQKIGSLLTPSTKETPMGEGQGHSAGDHAIISEYEDFDWSSDADEDLAEMANALSSPSTIRGDDQQPPRKAPRTPQQTSPHKRSFSDMKHEPGQDQADKQWSSKSDVFATPATTIKPDCHEPLLSPIRSPFDSISKFKTELNTSSYTIRSSLATEVLHILKPIRSHLTPTIEHNLTELLNTHDLRTQGIAKGRDITRLAVQAKEKKIAELQAMVADLEAERETSRTVIAHLKQDIATSPKRTTRFKPDLSRSNV